MPFHSPSVLLSEVRNGTERAKNVCDDARHTVHSRGRADDARHSFHGGKKCFSPGTSPRRDDDRTLRHRHLHHRSAVRRYCRGDSPQPAPRADEHRDGEHRNSCGALRGKNRVDIVIKPDALHSQPSPRRPRSVRERLTGLLLLRVWNPALVRRRPVHHDRSGGLPK